jgi:hypothetical protein
VANSSPFVFLFVKNKRRRGCSKKDEQGSLPASLSSPPLSCLSLVPSQSHRFFRFRDLHHPILFHRLGRVNNGV